MGKAGKRKMRENMKIKEKGRKGNEFAILYGVAWINTEKTNIIIKKHGPNFTPVTVLKLGRFNLDCILDLEYKNVSIETS